MKRKNIIICLIIGMMLIVSLNVLINYPTVSAGRWVYDSTVEDVYNVTISSDDAVAVINDYFSSNGESITLKTNIYDSIIGIRFDNISIPSNSTYEYRPVNAYLSLYSDHYPYDPLSEKVTIYFETGNENIQTYSNYTDLVSRSTSYNYRNWDLDNVHGLNSTTGQWNDSPNIVILVTGATGFDNNTISFLIYSDRGVWFRYFRTIDCFVDYAPRLHIISQIYEYEEDPPTGAEGSEFIETYRDLDIWLLNRTGWVNYTDTWTDFDSANYMNVVNSTYVSINDISNEDGTVYLGKESITSIGNVKFGLNISGVIDGQSGSSEPLFIPYGFGKGFVGLGYFVDYNGATKYYIGICIFDSNADAKLDDVFRIGFICYNELTLYYSGAGMNHTLGTYWLDVNYDFPSKDMTVDIYSDMEMTTLLETRVRVDYAPMETGYEDEYSLSNLGSLVGVTDGYVNGSLKSLVDDFIYYVTDEDGNIIVELTDPPYEDIQDVRDWIDNYLSASPEYDKTPWMGDFTLLLVGLVGVAFIPLGFLIFVSSARDGDIIGGLQTLVLMFFIGIGMIVTWLWA